MKKIVYFLAMLGLYTVTNAQTQKGNDINGEAAGDRSGHSVSMPDANTIAIGATLNGGGGTQSGHVRVYQWLGNTWTQKGADLDGEAGLDNAGESVSMPDANTVAFGAPQNGGNGASAGHVRIFQWNGNAWSQKGSDIDGEASGDLSGYCVSMPDANIIAIGGYNNDGNGANSGHVRIYEWNGSAWVQRGADINGEAANDNSGYSVSMPDANTVAIGAPLNDGTGTDAGHVRIYSWNGLAWTQKGGDINAEAAGDRFGCAVSMPDPNTVAIGAWGNDGSGTDAGHARIYFWNGTAWAQKGTDINGVATVDNAGWSVSMPSPDRVAVGMPGNDGGAGDAGSVRLYAWNGSAWNQLGADIYGEAAADASARSISMPNVNTVAIGARRNDGNGVDAGHARVYSLCSNTNSSISPTACTSYVSPSGNFTWTTSGTYNDVIPNSAGCDSLISINLTIINASAPTGSATQTFCNSATVSDLSASGTSIQWYAGPSGGLPLPGATALVNGTTYYASQSVSGCESATRLAVMAVITTTNAPNGTATQTFCNSATIADLSATGTSIQWYAAASGGLPLPGTSALVNGTTYYASQTVSGCESATRLAVTAIVNTTSAPNGAATQAFCNSATIADLAATGTSIQWYAAASGGLPLPGTTALVNGTTYYASQTVSGCESATRLAVNVAINSVTDLTTTVSGVAISANNTLATYIWLDCNNNYAIIPGETAQTFTPTSNGSYAVQLTQDGCVDTSACVVITTIALEEIDENSAIMVSPNPTSGVFSIDLGQLENTVLISISDINGRIIRCEKFDAAQVIPFVMDEPSGFYFIHVDTGDHRKSFLLILE